MEREPMAKVQKGIMVPEDLYRLIADHERRTGGTFTRITVAALLQFFLSRPEGHDAAWINYAVALEKGERTVSEVAIGQAKDRVLNAHTRARTVKGCVDNGTMHKEALTPALRELEDARGVLAQWESIAAREGDDMIAKIIADRTEKREQKLGSCANEDQLHGLIDGAWPKSDPSVEDDADPDDQSK